MTTEQATTAVRIHEGGMPIGVYQILYYRVTAAGVRRLADCDINVSAGYVQRAAKALATTEALVATCMNQPGGMTAAGTAETLRHLLADDEVRS